MAEERKIWYEESAPRRRRRGRAVLVVAIAIAMGIAGWRWRTRLRPPPAPARTWVRATLRQLPAAITTSGSVRLRSGAQVRVGSQVSGIVRELDVSVGTEIKAGEVIARIDPRPLAAKAAEAQSQEKLDEVALAKAERDDQRGRELLQGGLIPRQQEEDLAWQLQSAQAQLAAARAQLAAAQLDLSYCVIRSPITGVVSSVSTQEGETVAAAFAAPTFITIVERDALELAGMVDETDIGEVRPGDPVQFTVETYPDRTLTATVTRIDPAATIISGVVNYGVIAALGRAPAFLRPDMTANLVIQTGARRALMLPDAAVGRDGGGSYVLVRNGAAAQRRGAAVGLRVGGWTEVTSGVGAGDWVALNPGAEGNGGGNHD
ncbi:MAG TPA: efflux RND transporter periplasmic adaptor subunit [Terriglobales bacterium]|nr:efflux RND transporter periplasmic adaptor subunit [Terriglobales bacterium]